MNLWANGWVEGRFGELMEIVETNTLPVVEDKSRKKITVILRIARHLSLLRADVD